MRGHSSQRLALTAVAAALVAFSGYELGRARAASDPEPGAPTPPPAAARGPRDSFAPAVASAAPAVVHVKVTSLARSAFPGAGGPGAVRQGAGSGFIIGADGLILTNNHVVDDAREITVTLKDGRELPARVTGRDPKTDLAVIKVEGDGPFPVATLGDSDALSIGDWVIAIGNPFGLDNTVTAGIVSAKGRAIGAGPYDEFIQTDAPINPGNSGGPLLDESGAVVGINTAIFSRGGGSIGIGFAVPINMAKRLVPQLQKDGHVTRGWLGVTLQKLTPDLAETMKVEAGRGALVSAVTADGPAAHAGVAPGDVIVRYDGTAIDGHASLPSLVAATPVGKTVEVEALRDGATRTFAITIARLDEPVAAVESETPSRVRWGLGLQDLTPDDRKRLGLERDAGVGVADVAPGSPADAAGVQAGDVVLAVNRHAVASSDAVRREVGKAPSGQPLLLLLRGQDGSNRFVALRA
jgi:serine protease Do